MSKNKGKAKKDFALSNKERNKLTAGLPQRIQAVLDTQSPEELQKLAEISGRTVKRIKTLAKGKECNNAKVLQSVNNALDELGY